VWKGGAFATVCQLIFSIFTCTGAECAEGLWDLCKIYRDGIVPTGSSDR